MCKNSRELLSFAIIYVKTDTKGGSHVRGQCTGKSHRRYDSSFYQ